MKPMLPTTILIVMFAAGTSRADVTRADKAKYEKELQEQFDKPRCGKVLKTKIAWETFKGWPESLSVKGFCNIAVAFTWVCDEDKGHVEAMKKFDTFVCKAGDFSKEKNCEKRLELQADGKSIVLTTGSPDMACNSSQVALRKLRHLL